MSLENFAEHDNDCSIGKETMNIILFHQLEISILTYQMKFTVQNTTNAVLPPFDVSDEIIPDQCPDSTIFNHRLMAPPAVHASGLVMQVLVWNPRSTHCLLLRSKFHAEFTWYSKNYKNILTHYHIVSLKTQFSLNL